MAKKIIEKGKRAHKNKSVSKKYSKKLGNLDGEKFKENSEISELEKELKSLKLVKPEKIEKDEEGKEESEEIENINERFIEFFQPLLGIQRQTEISETSPAIEERRQELEQLEHSIAFDLASPRIRSGKDKYEESKYDSKYEEKYEEKTPDYTGSVTSEKKETNNRSKSF